MIEITIIKMLSVHSNSHALFLTTLSMSLAATESLSSLARAAMSVVFTVTVDLISDCASLILSKNTLKETGIHDFEEFSFI